MVEGGLVEDGEVPEPEGAGEECPGGKRVAEWAERAEVILPDHTLHVRIDGAGDEPRTVLIERPAADTPPR